MTADDLEALMDDAFRRGLAQAEYLNTVDNDGKARVALKEITDLLKVGLEYLAAKKGPVTEPWGSALSGKNGAAS